VISEPRCDEFRDRATIGVFRQRSAVGQPHDAHWPVEGGSGRAGCPPYHDGGCDINMDANMEEVKIEMNRPSDANEDGNTQKGAAP
jgi:hypothetical protein